MESNSSDGLDEVLAGRAAAADRLTTPWWYQPALGILLGGYIVALGNRFDTALREQLRRP